MSDLTARLQSLASEFDQEAIEASAAIEAGETPFEIWSAQERAKTLREVRRRLRAALQTPAGGNAPTGITGPGDEREVPAASPAGPHQEERP